MCWTCSAHPSVPPCGYHRICPRGEQKLQHRQVIRTNGSRCILVASGSTLLSAKKITCTCTCRIAVHQCVDDMGLYKPYRTLHKSTKAYNATQVLRNSCTSPVQLLHTLYTTPTQLLQRSHNSYASPIHVLQKSYAISTCSNWVSAPRRHCPQQLSVVAGLHLTIHAPKSGNMYPTRRTFWCGSIFGSLLESSRPAQRAEQAALHTTPLFAPKTISMLQIFDQLLRKPYRYPLYLIHCLCFFTTTWLRAILCEVDVPKAIE